MTDDELVALYRAGSYSIRQEYRLRFKTPEELAAEQARESVETDG
jgi:hypothetical protein